MSLRQYVVLYKLPGDQVRSPRKQVIEANSPSDAVKVFKNMMPEAIVLGQPQLVR